MVRVVKFGLFYILQQPPGKSAVQVYEDNLEQFRVADEVGFDEIFLGEHRISEYGTLPNPLVLAAAAQYESAHPWPRLCQDRGFAP